MRLLAFFTGVLLVGAPCAPAGAQATDAPRPRALLQGTVFDSLTGRPLVDAEIVLPGVASVARTDAQGRFSLAAPPGRYRVSFTHRRVSAWKAVRHEREVLLQVGEEHVVALATASAATVLERTCGGEGAVVGGQVQDLLTLMPLLGASVDARTEGEGVGSSMRTVSSGLDGGYFVCLASGGAVELRARMSEARSRTVQRPLEDGSVLVQDLYLQVTEPAVLDGSVLDGETGGPLDGAIVEVVGTRLRTVTTDDGTFRFNGVPPGYVQVAVERLGYGRGIAGATVEGGGHVGMRLSLFPEAIALDSLVVSVTGPTPETMREGARFDGLTRPQIEALLPRSHSFLDLLRGANVPGLKLKDTYYVTDSGSRMYGVCIETGRTSTMVSEQCEMVEVYLNDVRLSDPNTVLLTLSPEVIEEVRILSRTEATFRYGGSTRARNGILLIRTRGR